MRQVRFRKMVSQKHPPWGAGWLSRLSVRLLILAQAMITQFMSSSPTFVLHWQQGACLGFSLSAPPPHTLSLKNKWTFLKKHPLRYSTLMKSWHFKNLLLQLTSWLNVFWNTIFSHPHFSRNGNHFCYCHFFSFVGESSCGVEREIIWRSVYSKLSDIIEDQRARLLMSKLIGFLGIMIPEPLNW